MKLLAFTLALLLAFPVVAVAEEPAEPAAVTGLEEGQPAPHAGLLLTETRFRSYVDLQLRLEEAEGRIEVRDKLLEDVGKQVDQARQRSWFESNGIYIGIVLGMAFTGLAVFGAAELGKATR